MKCKECINYMTDKDSDYGYCAEYGIPVEEDEDNPDCNCETKENTSKKQVGKSADDVLEEKRQKYR